jgi:hypothetical protein
LDNLLLRPNSSRNALRQMALVAVVAVALIIWKWDFIGHLYFQDQITHMGLIINGLIIAMFLLGMMRMVVMLSAYAQEASALQRFLENHQKEGVEDLLEGVAEESIISRRYHTMAQLNSSRVPINHSALAAALVAAESSKNTFPRFVNNSLILAGVFGTIISLAISLLGASNLLQSAADVSGMGMMVHGMSTALAATINAIFCYLLFGYFFLKLTDVQTNLISEVEQVTTNYLIPKFQVHTENILSEFKGLISSLQELVGQMQQSQTAFEKLELHIDNTLAAHESATESLATDMATIKDLLRAGFRLPEEP